MNNMTASRVAGDKAVARGSARHRSKVAILVNLLAPGRVPIFQRLAERFDLTVIYSGEEGNRKQWRELNHEGQGFRVERARGFTFVWNRQGRQELPDTRYLHLNPGLLTSLLSLQPDAIITGEMGFRTIVALVYGRFFRRPVWVWWGGTIHTERAIGLGKRLLRRLLVGRVSRWFSYGASSTDYLVSLGVPPEKVLELQNCVPEEAYLSPTCPSIHLDVRPVLLCVGQLIPRKGLDLLLEASARLQAEGVSFSLLLVGDGPEKPILEQRVKDLGLKDVHFHPSRSPFQMPDVYRSGDIFVFPTREDVWGLVVNEALWSGLPALVSIYAGCAKELVPPESTFDPLDPADFLSKLRSAVLGQLPGPDLSRLRGIGEISELIVHDLNLVLGVK